MSDRYNAGALVNKGNCLFRMGDLQRARDYFQGYKRVFFFFL